MAGLDRQQRHYCHRQPELIQSMADGVRLAIGECQRQFRHHRWNCSTNGQDLSLFGRHVLSSLSRETAFIYAITSAGVVHSITRWCSLGLLNGCACDPTRVAGGRDRDVLGEFSWSGCSQYIRYGLVFARQYIDRQDRLIGDANALMNLHNNRVGRQIVAKNMRTVCKCHGISASCLVRTCWRLAGDFGTVGRQLMARYGNARQVNVVQTRSRQGLRRTRGARVWRRTVRSPTDSQLIYLDTSPDYCNVNPKYAFSGTEGRVCNKSSTGAPNSCDIMCCANGYRTRRLVVKYKCACRFYWCCHVKCQECKKTLIVNTCKSH